VQNLRLVGFAHALAHRLAGYKIPHAIAVGLLLPHVMRHNLASPVVAARYDRLACGAHLADGPALIEVIADLPGRFGVRAKLSAWSVARATEADLDALARGAESDPLARFAPLPIPIEALRAMVRSAW